MNSCRAYPAVAGAPDRSRSGRRVFEAARRERLFRLGVEQAADADEHAQTSRRPLRAISRTRHAHRSGLSTLTCNHCQVAEQGMVTREVCCRANTRKS